MKNKKNFFCSISPEAAPGPNDAIIFLQTLKNIIQLIS